MLTLEEAKKVFEALSIGFKPVESRMQFNRNRPNSIEHQDITQHVIGYKLPPEHQSTIPMYGDISQECRDIIGPYIEHALAIIDSHTVDVQQIFLIVSSIWCGKPRHFKHIHTLLQSGPQRCNTMSVPIPLYIDRDDNAYHRFYWNYRDTLYPKITYTSAERMERLPVEYIGQDIPKTSTSSIIFDSSRTAHYIDNTSHLYLWVVADGVTLPGDHQTIGGLRIKTHINYESTDRQPK